MARFPQGVKPDEGIEPPQRSYGLRVLPLDESGALLSIGYSPYLATCRNYFSRFRIKPGELLSCADNPKLVYFSLGQFLYGSLEERGGLDLDTFAVGRADD
jgi:hypothetical protein